MEQVLFFCFLLFCGIIHAVGFHKYHEYPRSGIMSFVLLVCATIALLLKAEKDLWLAFFGSMALYFPFVIVFMMEINGSLKKN